MDIMGFAPCKWTDQSLSSTMNPDRIPAHPVAQVSVAANSNIVHGTLRFGICSPVELVAACFDCHHP